MNILYHLTILPPKMPACEALSQEITALRHRFGGELLYLNPNQYRGIYLPRLAFGFHRLKHIRSLEKKLDVHHIYNPDPFPFPVLHYLRRPIIYSISSGVDNRQPNLAFFSSLAAIAVPDERSFTRLVESGLENIFLVRSGVDTSRFSFSPTPLHSEIKLMIASAPWSPAQFRAKGVDALLEAAQLNKCLRLIFLWRGVLADEMNRRIERLNLAGQVEVINEQVDVNRVLAEVHATITLATEAGIVKSYPHSLLDSLAAGKPVLVSRAIPMSDYVERSGCGQVVEEVSAAGILSAIEALAQNYSYLQNSARQVGQRDFSQQSMLASFQKVYQHAAQNSRFQKAG